MTSLTHSLTLTLAAMLGKIAQAPLQCFLIADLAVAALVYAHLSSLVLAVTIFVALFLAVLAFIVTRIRKPWHHAVETASIEKERLPEVRGHAYDLYGGKITDPKTDYGLPHEPVEILVPENKEQGEPAHSLRGWFIPPRDRSLPEAKVLVVCLHGAGRDRRAFLRHSPCLYASGFGIVLFDMREHGLSDRDFRGITYGPREAADVLSMTAYAKKTMGFKFVVTVGTSTGASASIIAAASDPNNTIDALVCECPFASKERLLQENIAVRLGKVFRFLLPVKELVTRLALFTALHFLPVSRNPALNRSPLQAVPLISPRPIFLLHGGRDVLISADHSRQLHDAARAPKEIWICPKVVNFIQTAFAPYR